MIIAVFLDDDRPDLSPDAAMRLAWFKAFKNRHGIADDAVVWVATAKEAIVRLKSRRVQYVSLDHDLAEPGDAEYPPASPPQFLSHQENMAILESAAKSGYDAARWIFHAVKAGAIPRPLWEVHSQNPIGRRRICDVLSGL